MLPLLQSSGVVPFRWGSVKIGSMYYLENNTNSDFGGFTVSLFSLAYARLTFCGNKIFFYKEHNIVHKQLQTSIVIKFIF